MDIHPPQGAHTSYLRTLSKIRGLREVLLLASPDISSEGADYHTSNFVFVNTFEAIFFRFAPIGLSAGRRLRRFALTS
jgi:hypothetical protein